jgi:serine/threonine-protein kinase
MGEVWRAFDTAMNRVVALKVLPVNFADDKQYQVRFRREAQAAAGLDEPHVVPIHDFGEIDGRLYVTMRLIDGKTVHELLVDGPLAPERAVWIIEQIAAALNAAHRVGLVHRDVKPSNILVTEDDFAYLIDFGIARAAGATKLTSTGATIGTLAYMAPERFTSDRADARADIYALACVLYECLTGSQPFPGDSLERQITSHLTLPPPRPSMQPGVSPQMDQVIATGMAKDPDQRYPTTKDLAAAARAAVAMPISLDQPTPAMNWAPSAPSWPAPLTYPDTSPNAPSASPSTQHRMPAEPAVWPPIPVPVPDWQPAQTGRPSWRGPAIVILAALTAVAVIVAIVLFITLPNKSSNSHEIASSSEQDHPSAPSANASNSSVPGKSSSASVPTSSTPKGPTQLQTADGLSALLANMRDRFRDTMGYQLVIYPDYAVTERADPKNTHVKQNYMYRDGGWKSWAPDMSTTPFDYLADLSAFNVTEVTAKLVGAPQALGSTTDGAQSYLIVQGASGGGLGLSIHVNAPGTGFMEINADGSVKQVHPP